MDKYNSESQNKETGLGDTMKKSEETKDESTDGTETDTEVDTGTKIMNKDKNILKDSIQEDRGGFPDSSLNKEKTKEIGKMIPSSLYGQSNVVDKINRMEALLESERKAQDKDAKSLNKKMYLQIQKLLKYLPLQGVTNNRRQKINQQLRNIP